MFVFYVNECHVCYRIKMIDDTLNGESSGFYHNLLYNLLAKCIMEFVNLIINLFVLYIN